MMFQINPYIDKVKLSSNSSKRMDCEIVQGGLPCFHGQVCYHLPGRFSSTRLSPFQYLSIKFRKFIYNLMGFMVILNPLSSIFLPCRRKVDVPAFATDMSRKVGSNMLPASFASAVRFATAHAKIYYRALNNMPKAYNLVSRPFSLSVKPGSIYGSLKVYHNPIHPLVYRIITQVLPMYLSLRRGKVIFLDFSGWSRTELQLKNGLNSVVCQKK
jgi:hypothetical protein